MSSESTGSEGAIFSRAPNVARQSGPPPQTPYPPRPYPPRGDWPPPQTPYPPRPYPPRPYPPREEAPDCTLDPFEWSADVADLFCAESALVRLGARLVYDEDDLPIAAIEWQADGANRPKYLERPKETEPKSTEDPELKESEKKPEARVSERHVHPKEHELAVKVIIPNDLACTLAEYPDVAWALKHDLARALALRADQAFLHGAGPPDPLGITQTGLVQAPAQAAADLLALVRLMVSTVRTRVDARFGCAGWILHPDTLDQLSKLVTADGLNVGAGAGAWTLDAVTLLTNDGGDGGMLVGYPFIVTRAARDGNATMLHFSSDWSEAWIGAHRRLLTVDVSVDVQFQTDETVIRAVMYHDFVVRKPSYFTYADPETAIEED